MLMKLLFVEDDQAIAMGLVYTLKKEGYEVVWCDHKRSALQQLDQQTFDLLLLDVGLPDGSGYDICTYAKSRQDVPVLFLTALDDEGNVVMGLDMGGDDYITKPFRINELLSKMVKGSNNYKKQRNKVAKLHAHIGQQRKDFLHKESRKIANSWDMVVVEDIDMKAMSQGLQLGKNLMDNGFGTLRNYLK